MMAASMGPNFTGGPPAGMGHPGVAGHTMGPGMPHNPQQGAPGGQARVNGGSNYDSLKVAKCLVI